MDSLSLVDPESFDADQHIWLATGLPTRGSKPTLGSYLRSTEATPHEDTIDVHIVRGGADDPPIDALADRYTSDLVDVTLHDTPTSRELRSLFESDHDLLHYCGTVTDDGLACADAPLDVRTLPRTGVSAFFLDGASTYRQGLALVRVGAIAGVVTTTDHHRDDRVGEHLATLLDAGFSIATAVDILSRVTTDSPFTVVGDGDHQLSTAKHTPILYRAAPETATADTARVGVHIYPNLQHRIGSTVSITSDATPDNHLAGDFTVDIDRDVFEPFAERLEFPILADGDLHWPESHTTGELWALLTNEPA
jgi:hypothetical protein